MDDNAIKKVAEFMKYNKNPAAICNFIEELNKDDSNYWDYMSKNPDLKDDYIIKNKDRLNWKLLIENQKFSESLLGNELIADKLMENIDHLLEYQLLPSKFITDYVENNNLEEVNWNTLVKRQHLSEDFMRKYKNYLDWYWLSQEQWMTLEFIMEFADIDENGVGIHWDVLPCNQEISYLLNDGFVILFQNKEIWENIGWIDNLSEDCITKFKDRIPDTAWADLLEHHELSEKFLRDFISEHEQEMDDDLWEAISTGQKLSMEFMEEFKENLNWYELCLHQEMDSEFVRKMKDYINLNNLSMNDCLTESMIEKVSNLGDEFRDNFDWEFISEYGNISKEFAEMNDKIDKKLFAMNDNKPELVENLKHKKVSLVDPPSNRGSEPRCTFDGANLVC